MKKDRIIGLIGGAEIAKYSLADKIWQTIFTCSKQKNIKFMFWSIDTKDELKTFIKNTTGDEKFIGSNVALPWKNEVVQFCQPGDPIVQQSGISNLIVKRDKKLVAYNTDGAGVYHAISHEGFNPIKKRILILGAGGAGMAAAFYWSQLGSNSVYVSDIQKDKLKSWQNNYEIQKLGINFIDFEKMNKLLPNVDLLINATPVGKKKELNEILLEHSSPISFFWLKNLKPQAWVQEMNYAPYETEILKQAQCLGLKIIRGVDMLVWQAIFSYYQYFDQTLTNAQIAIIIKKSHKIAVKYL